VHHPRLALSGSDNSAFVGAAEPWLTAEWILTHHAHDLDARGRNFLMKWSARRQEMADHTPRH
jgi:hypothetical protein